MVRQEITNAFASSAIIGFAADLSSGKRSEIFVFQLKDSCLSFVFSGIWSSTRRPSAVAVMALVREAMQYSVPSFGGSCFLTSRYPR